MSPRLRMSRSALETNMALLRIHRVLALTGLTRSPLYDQMGKGLFVKPVKIGPRAAAIPAHEVKALVDARIAGKSDAEIRALVEKLHADRATAGARQ